MTRPSPTSIATAMLEASFMALMWLAAFALITRNPHYRGLALAGIAGVSLAVAAILAIPRAWLTGRALDSTSFAGGSRPRAKADAPKGTASHRAAPAHRPDGASPTPNREPGHEL